MNDNTHNFSKQAKLHLCCANDELRPVMNNIYFDNGYAVATDGHILACAYIEEISSLNPEDIEKLNGKLLNAASYKELLKYSDICITDTAIEAKKSIGIYGTMKVSFDFTTDTTPLNYKSVLDDICVPKNEKEQVPKVFTTGFNVKSLKRITDAFGTELIDLKYTSRKGAIQVILRGGPWKSKAIIMPLIPEEDYK